MRTTKCNGIVDKRNSNITYTQHDLCAKRVANLNFPKNVGRHQCCRNHATIVITRGVDFAQFAGLVSSGEVQSKAEMTSGDIGINLRKHPLIRTP